MPRLFHRQSGLASAAGVWFGFAFTTAALAAVLCLATLGVTASHAASIGVSPTLVEVNRGESMSGLRVRNGESGDGARAVSVQARVVRWRQDETGNVYEPATEVVASPPVTRIAPGAENLIRIVRTATHPVAGEESYRLLLDQLPEPDTAQAGGVVSILIRHSVPVFFAAPAAAPAQPQWQIERLPSPPTPLPVGEGRRIPDGGWRVTVTNTGDKRLRLANLALFDAGGVLVAGRQGLVGYVLGGSRRVFEVKAVENAAENAAVSAPALRLSVQVEAGPLETELLPVVFP